MSNSWRDSISAAQVLNRRVQDAQQGARGKPDAQDHQDHLHHGHLDHYNHRHEPRYDYRPEPRPPCDHRHDPELGFYVEPDPFDRLALYPEIRPIPPVRVVPQTRVVSPICVVPPLSMVEDEHYIVQRINGHNKEAEKHNNRIYPDDLSAEVIPKLCMLGPHHGKYPPHFQNDMTLRQMDMFLDTYQLTAILEADAIPIPWYNLDKRPQNFSTRPDYQYSYNRVAEMKERKLHALLEFLGARVGL